MFNFSGLEIQNSQSVFEKNEEQVNRIVCRGMAYAFLVFPVMLFLNEIGLFQFSESVVFMLAGAGTFCTLSPLLLSKFVKNQVFLKYYALICIIVLVSVLGSEYYVGIYITVILAPIVSCLYFDKKFTTKIVIISYIGYLISYYFRCEQARDIHYPEESVWLTYIPLAAGYTLEFIVSLIFLYRIADRSHSFLLEQKNMIENMAKNETKMQFAMEATTDILFEYDIPKNIYASNGSIFDWERREITVENFKEYIEKIDWKTNDFVNAIQKYGAMPAEEGSRFQEEMCLTWYDGGRENPLWGYFELIILRDSAGAPRTLLGKIRNITEQKLAELKNREAKNYDTLTGMYHYNSLRRIVRETEGVHQQKTHQVMIINIKNYQEIGKNYGEIYRDFVIMNLAEVIKKNTVGEGILTCRLSDEVFLIYIEDCKVTDARQIRQGLNADLSSLYIGENAVNKLQYDFGYYLGKEDIDKLFHIALQYVNITEAPETEDGKYDTMERIGALPAMLNGHTFQSYRDAEQEKMGNIFIQGISNLISAAKDNRSGIQMSLNWIGSFFELDGIRVYELSDAKEKLFPEFIWSASDTVERECSLVILEHPVAHFFIENFGRSRVVDNTIGAFRDFFRRFDESPLLLEKYSSLIYPIQSGEECRAVILYDIRKTNYTWSDEQKEFLLELSNILGNALMPVLKDAMTKEKYIFLSNMSHELRMPLSAIVGLTEIAGAQGGVSCETQNYLDKIDESAQKLVTILDDILDLSKMEIGKMKFTKEIFSLEDLLAQVEHSARKATEVKGITFSLEKRFQENLLCGDEARITQILIYLIQNAVKYTNVHGQISLLVEELANDGKTVSLFFRVKDNGVGVPPEAIDKLFTAFEQIDTLHSDKRGDTGLVLSVCYQLIRLMGGKLNVRSEQGKGSELYFTLKLEVSSKEDMLRFFTDKSELEKETVSLEEKTVLIAEDNVTNADIMRRLFEMNGARVLVANNGAQCVDIFQQSKEGEIAFILMDVNMPALNGHEATKEIRKSGRKDAERIPIIAMSANTFEEDIKESLMAGMDAHLMKPIQLQPLLEEVAKIIRQKKAKESPDIL